MFNLQQFPWLSNACCGYGGGAGDGADDGISGEEFSNTRARGFSLSSGFSFDRRSAASLDRQSAASVRRLGLRNGGITNYTGFLRYVATSTSYDVM